MLSYKIFNREKYERSWNLPTMIGVYGEEMMGVQHVWKWICDFLNGCEEVHDPVRVGWLSTARTSDSMDGVCSLLEDDCQYTVRLLEYLMSNKLGGTRFQSNEEVESLMSMQIMLKSRNSVTFQIKFFPYFYFNFQKLQKIGNLTFLTTLVEIILNYWCQHFEKKIVDQGNFGETLG